MSDITAATDRVRHWRIVATVLYWTALAGPWVLALSLRYTGHKGRAWGLLVLVISVTVYTGWKVAQRRLRAACEEHPLIYLVKLREAFGAK